MRVSHAEAILRASLTVDGPEASDRKREVCRQVAREEGVKLVPEAQTAATIHLGDDGNRVELKDGRPPRKLGQGATDGICRVAIAAALRADTRVGNFESGTLPDGCTLVGALNGQDRGALFDDRWRPGSFDSALLVMKLEALRLGANCSVEKLRS